MIFDRTGNGTSEINALLGAGYYANNDFAAIRPFVEDETETIVRFIGKELYSYAHDIYQSDVSTDELVEHVQRAIALMAVYRFNQANIMSHEDNGRKLKIDNEHEKIGWEWMYDRDDAAMLRRAYTAIDRLLNYCEEQTLPEWINSEKRIAARSLLISSSDEFDNVYPIEQSPRFYYSLLPFIREAQSRWLPYAVGTNNFHEFVQKYIDNNITTDNEKHMLALMRKFIALKSIEIATKRLTLSIFPEGVVQRFVANDGGRSSKPAETEVRREQERRMKVEADEALNEVKLFNQQLTAADTLYPVMPNNRPDKKYFMT